MEQSVGFQNQEAPFSSVQQYAGFFQRLAAYLIDWTVLGLVTLSIEFCLGANPFQVLSAKSLEEINAYQAQTRWVYLLLYGFSFVYTLLFWVNFEGATPGKRLLGIKVVKEDGAPLNFASAFIRYFGYLLSAMVLGLGYLWVAFDKRKQGWHDKLARTVVVKTDKKPNTCLVLFLCFLALVFYLGYIGMFFAKGVMLGIEEDNQKQKVNAPLVTMKKSTEEMPVEAKIHWDRSQELFKQMREEADDPEAVKRLNDENISELKKALEIAPENARIWVELGHAYTWVSTEGSLEDSLAAYKKAEELEPNNVVYSNFVGDMLIDLGKYEEAVMQFQKSLRITDKSGYAYVSLGTAYARLKIYDEANENLEKGIEILKESNKDGQLDDDILKAQKELSNIPR